MPNAMLYTVTTSVTVFLDTPRTPDRDAVVLGQLHQNVAPIKQEKEIKKNKITIEKE